MQSRTYVINPIEPFDFTLTAGYHTYFSGHYGADSLQDGIYRRLLEVNQRLLLASVRVQGNEQSPQLEVTLEGDGVDEEDAREAVKLVGWVLGVDTPVEQFYLAVQQDPVLKAVTNGLYGLHPPHTTSLFEALVMAVTGQQIATNVARIIRTLLIQTHGAELSVDGQAYYAFPTPQALFSAGVEGLRKLKLSTRKAEYIVGIASSALEGSLDQESLSRLTDEQVGEQIMGLRGVGQWTTQWILIRGLGRLDAFPAGDLALRRVISQGYFQGRVLSEGEVEEFSRRWSPYRSLATVYLLAAARMGLVETVER